ncbi:Protein of unknown function [Pyronema omphalodes CBS 100304]|uniref:Uncharacterized protein n=1 Tax=Pyronema omphalodes (strain CBS 100304) TaxID=1076935 RepID=U4LP01_PYROM|nr:Protein of unknown function [Pyronema omphalodes CBS 100304]
MGSLTSVRPMGPMITDNEPTNNINWYYYGGQRSCYFSRCALGRFLFLLWGKLI